MKKKIVISMFLAFSVLIISGCGNNKEEKGNSNEAVKNNNEAVKESAKGSSGETKTSATGLCKDEKVNLPNYGDPGKRLKNCFVEYPGEPSRQDKSYYIVEDICGQFTQEFMENAFGKKITKIELPKIATLNNCTYYLDDKEYVMLNLEYLAIENQKKGNEFAGYKVEKNSQIPMDNLVAWQDDNLINGIYLVINPNKFISLRPSSKNTITKDDFLKLAANIAKEIKNYK